MYQVHDLLASVTVDPIGSSPVLELMESWRVSPAPWAAHKAAGGDHGFHHLFCASLAQSSVSTVNFHVPHHVHESIEVAPFQEMVMNCFSPNRAVFKIR